ncbi:MAG: DUF167 domain-containing protein [Cellulomonas sp.]|uniref:DUF167 family protein n=1 Tax=Cellulomonas sp. TaxID=40001 RepID=UPI002586A2EC|nr:DUF167 family protein [Cellulomonas sp.]MCR6704118.1 DUF167 domain-containing protein [Cellulomonas sp.]
MSRAGRDPSEARGLPHAGRRGLRRRARRRGLRARAVDGAATEAALAAVADAFGVRRRHVDLVTGATSRDKVVELDDTALDDGPARLAELRDG